MSLLPIGGGTLEVSGTATAQDVTAYVCNAATGAQGEYTNYPFNSLAVIGGVALGCVATGVFALSGGTDAGTAIDAVVTSGVSDFSDEKNSAPALQQKRVDSCYFNARVTVEGLAARAIVDEQTDRVYSVSMPPSKAQGLSPIRVKMGKGLQGRNWQFGIENISGGDFELERMDVVPVILSRRY